MTTPDADRRGILFVLSSLCYIASSIRAGDPVSLAGGVFFLVACLVFLVPLLAELIPARGADAPDRSWASGPSRGPRGGALA